MLKRWGTAKSSRRRGWVCSLPAVVIVRPVLIASPVNIITEVGELKRTLQSLACGQKRVLRKHPLGRDVDETDGFYFNADFTDPRAKVHINSIQAKETVSKLLTPRPWFLTPRKHRRSPRNRSAHRRISTATGSTTSTLPLCES